MTQMDVVNSPYTVTIQVGKNSKFNQANFIIHNPYNGVTESSPPGSQSFNNTNQVQLQMTDHLMLVQIFPVMNSGSSSTTSAQVNTNTQVDTNGNNSSSNQKTESNNSFILSMSLFWIILGIL